MPKSKAREHLLQAAEVLFVQRGYEAVTVKDIAKAAGIHHASIYHHVPGGKADLFIEVMTRCFHRHQAGIQEAIDAAGDDLSAQLGGISSWLLSQPPVDLIRLNNSDLPSIETESARQIEYLAYMALLRPIETVLEKASARGEIEHPNLGIIAGAILSSIEALHGVSEAYVQESRQQMAEQLIEVFVRGISRA
ncbi:MAG: TetR/AcrR family transcriptional regulator [Cyanobacteriota bacterium]|nr:TetR/AcrR family transcriptional regulator [Cyanobacteriota bacterium]